MLQEYKRKRDFKITPEPSGTESPKAKRSKKQALTFVIQKHDARRLHYDFRLEIDGVMVSWAVPKGPSLDTTERRLAVMTEDHPMAYSSFEGIIPAHQYGAGEVIIWDQGTYSPDEKGEYSWHDKAEANQRMREALKRGKLTFYIKGEKLEGSWTLVKMHNKEKDWLLIKHKDQFADTEQDVTRLDQSVVSGVTIEDLQRHGADKIWTRSGAKKANPKTTGKSTKPPKKSVTSKKNTKDPGRKQKIAALLEPGKAARFPKKIVPMLPTHSQKPFNRSGWFFEPKLDGIRAIAKVQSGEVELHSEENSDLSKDYPDVCKALTKYQGNFIFDGVIVEQDHQGKQLKRSKDAEASIPGARRASNPNAIYYIFDILHAEGKDVTALSLSERKQLLEVLLAPDKTIRIVDSLGKDGKAAFKACIEYGLEGVIGKRESSIYKPGTKSRSWSSVCQSSTKKSKKNSHDKVVHIDSVRRLIPCASSSKGKHKSSEHSRKGLRKKKEISNDARSVIEQLENSKEKLTLELRQFSIPLSSLSKVYWPEQGGEPAITKRDYLRYLAQVSDYLIPHLTDRLITLVRFPNGITGGRFYQKHWEQRLPEFVQTATVFTESENKDQKFLLCNNLPTLLWLGQIADLEIHTSHTRLKAESDAAHLPDDMSGSVETLEASIANYPDYIVLDLDPYLYSGREKHGAEPELHQKGFEKTAEIALLMKSHLDDLNLDCFVKTSGKTGLHLYIPIVRNVDYDRVRAISQVLCQQILKEHPNEVTMEWATKNRTGKVFLDHNMNARSKSLASIYSLRAAPEACISTPIDWSELRSVYPTDFNIYTVPQRLTEKGDLWQDILDHKVDLTEVLGSEVMNAKLSKKRRNTHSHKRASNQ